jgi:spermidine/putrescine transport system substrate-binding protein
MLPAKAEHFYAAEAMMNYVYEPEVAARIAAAVNYIPPVAGVQDILAKEDPKLAENPLIFPSDEIRAKLKPYPVLSPADERTMLEAMDKVIGG